jgi:hypothetical protein
MTALTKGQPLRLDEISPNVGTVLGPDFVSSGRTVPLCRLPQGLRRSDSLLKTASRPTRDGD